MCKHVHHDLIVQWAANPALRVQVKGLMSREWLDVLPTSAPQWHKDSEYRILPEKKKYRVVLYKFDLSSTPQPALIKSESHAVNLEKTPNFVRWLTDWVEYDIT